MTHRTFSNALLATLALASSATVAVRAELPPGFELIQITFDPDYYDRFASMNNCGQIAITKKLGSNWNDAEIFIYDNGRTTRLTYNSLADRSAMLNNRGDLFWARGDSGWYRQIYQWTGHGEELVIDVAYYLDPDDLNDSGQLLWDEFHGDGCAESDADVLIYERGENTQLTTGDASYQAGGISDDAHVVYTRYDFCSDPWESEIHYLSDGVDLILSAGQSFAQSPDINDNHQIVWDSAGDAYYIWRWDNGEVTMLTDNGGVPRINNAGDVTFWRWHDKERQFHTCLWKDGVIYELTLGANQYYPQAINDLGEIVIRMTFGFEQRGDFLLLRRIRSGDFDLDGRINASDYRDFARCMTDPVHGVPLEFSLNQTLCECRLVDFDEDDDVDLRDFSLFQSRYAPE